MTDPAPPAQPDVWVPVGDGNWLAHGLPDEAEVAAIVARLDSDYGKGDLPSKYVQAWLDVARLLALVAALPALSEPKP